MNIKYLDLQAINRPYEHAADEVLSSGWYLRGEATRRFEQHYADYIGTRHCIGCGNGLDALTLILRAYKEMGRLKDGDEVIVPANTYIASILSIVENRLRPVLVEPDFSTLQIDDSLIEPAITPRTRAVMIVHLYGQCAYTERIADICRRHHLLLIEDNAQAHGCTHHPPHTAGLAPSKTGSLGHAAAHSFYPTKNLGAFGDAGAITTGDDELAAVVRALGNYGSSRHYVFDRIGRNSRMDELQAAILDAKLTHLDSMNKRRREIAALYDTAINNPLITIARALRDHVYHIYPIFTVHRDHLRQYLTVHGIQTEVHYPIPPHRQLALSGLTEQQLPITDRIHREELSLPCNPALTTAEAEYIVSTLNNYRLS